MDKFYIGINGVQKGPFSKDELKAQGLNPSTLVWTDGMENWLQAIEVEKLKGLFQGTPPPIPNQNKPPIPVEIEKPIRVKAEISKKKEPLISNEGKVTVANETKAIFRLISLALVISLISFPIFYFGIYEVNKYDDFDYFKDVQKTVDRYGTTTYFGVNITDFPNWSGTMDYESVMRNIEYRKDVYTEKSWMSSLYTLPVTSAFLILFRYILKGVKWVKATSNEE